MINQHELTNKLESQNELILEKQPHENNKLLSNEKPYNASANEKP